MLVEVGQIEHVVDQRAHPGALLLDAPQRIVHTRRWDDALAHQVDITADGGQRSPQLVGGIGDEPLQPFL